jgi:hypothetical protein
MFGYFSSPDLRKGKVKGAEPVLLSSISWNSELKAGPLPTPIYHSVYFR